jgi:hypothetical protein
MSPAKGKGRLLVPVLASLFVISEDNYATRANDTAPPSLECEGEDGAFASIARYLSLMQGSRFVCDFDGIAWPFVTGVSRSPHARGLSLETCWEWETPIQVVGRARWPEVLAEALTYETMRGVGLYLDFAPAMESLRAQDVEPILMTDRPTEAIRDVRRILDDYGLSWLSVQKATPEQKISFCLEQGLRVIVDDHPETIEAAQSAGLRALSLRFPYNRDMIERLGVVNAPDWSTLEVLLLKEL